MLDLLESLGLDSIPFQPNSSRDSIFPTSQLTEAEKRLMLAALSKSIGVLSGDSGSGKTTVLRSVAMKLEAKGYRILYCSDSVGGSFGLLRTLHHVLGIKPPLYKVDLNQRFLETCQAIDEPLVLIVDEGQLIKEDGLQQLRLLMNREFDTKPPFSLLIAGCPELRDLIGLPRMTSLKKRILMSYHLDGFTEEEAKLYLEHHLKLSGARRKLFDPLVIKELFGYSRGNPRTFNQLALTALIATASSSKQIVGLEQLRQAVHELEARP